MKPSDIARQNLFGDSAQEPRGCWQHDDYCKQFLDLTESYSAHDSLLDGLDYTGYGQQETVESVGDELEQARLPESMISVSNTGLEGSTNIDTLQEIKCSPLRSPSKRSVNSDLLETERSVVWSLSASLNRKTTNRAQRNQEGTLEEPLYKFFMRNELESAGTIIHPQWNPLTEMLLNGAKFDGSYIIENSRRDDQLTKKVLTCSKDLIYKLIKNYKVLNGSAWRKLTKKEAFAIVRDELCAGDEHALSSWFGEDLKFGFKNATIDWLLGPAGEALLERITSEPHVVNLMETLDEQTESDIRTNVLSKLNHPVESQAFLAKKDKCTKLPCSSLCNKAACLYFYQRLLNRGLDYVITNNQSPASLRLRRAIVLVRNRIAHTEVGRRFLQCLGEPNERGYLQLKKQVPIYFEVLPTETPNN